MLGKAMHPLRRQQCVLDAPDLHRDRCCRLSNHESALHSEHTIHACVQCGHVVVHNARIRTDVAAFAALGKGTDDVRVTCVERKHT